MSQQSTPTSLNEQAQGGLFTLLVIKLGPFAIGELPDNAWQGSSVCGPKTYGQVSSLAAAVSACPTTAASVACLYQLTLLCQHCNCIDPCHAWLHMAPLELLSATCCTGNMRKLCELSRNSAVNSGSDQYEAIKQKHVCLSIV